MIKVAHLSDIHFFKYDLQFKSLFSKAILATLNHLFNRSGNKTSLDTDRLIQFLKSQQVTHLVITGDFTTSSNHEEYKLAQTFCKRLKDNGFKFISIPGNHDTYTKESETTKRFYKYIEMPTSLKETGIAHHAFNEEFTWITLDTTLATPLWSSRGHFTQEQEQALKDLLDSLGQEKPVILVNHFPVKSREPIVSRKKMVGDKRLIALMQQYPNIKLYLFGHTHLFELFDERPALINSGSLTLTQGGSLNIMELEKDQVNVCHYQNKDHTWTLLKERLVRFN